MWLLSASVLSSLAGEILRRARMRQLGAPRRLRRVAAAADEAWYAGRNHRADARDFAVFQGRQRVVLRAAETGVDRGRRRGRRQ
jgi:hypothetical protein